MSDDLDMAGEEDLRRGLRAAVAEEPPLGYAPDDLVAAGRRDQRRRRTALASGLAAAVTIGLVFTGVSALAGRSAPGATPAAAAGVGPTAALAVPLEIRPALHTVPCGEEPLPSKPQATAPQSAPPPVPPPSLPAGAKPSTERTTEPAPASAPPVAEPARQAKSADGKTCYVLGPDVVVLDRETTVQVASETGAPAVLLLRLAPPQAKAYTSYAATYDHPAIAFVKDSIVLWTLDPKDKSGDVQVTGNVDGASAQDVWRKLTAS